VAADIHSHLEINGPGYGLKLVRGKSNRKFKGTDEEVIEFLKTDLKLKPHQYTKSTLLGPKPIEDILKALKRGGKQKLELFAEKVEKPEGKATIVSEGDKRPALQPLFPPQETDPLT
jgi:hypothetical protein